MKILLTLFVLSFSSSVFSDEISDYQIEGIGIGDSLLKLFSLSEINKSTKVYYENSDKYYDIEINSDRIEFFETFKISVKKNDSNYVIHALSIGKRFKNNMEECFKRKEILVEDISNDFPGIKSLSYEYTYDFLEDGTSVAYITDFNLSDKSGAIRVYCIDWSLQTEKTRNFVDNLQIDISPKYYLNWLNNES